MGALFTPTRAALLAKTSNEGQQDIIQVQNSNSSTAFHMLPNGLIDPPIYTQVAYASLSSAQILAISNEAGIAQLIPAPGPNLFICPFNIGVIYLAGTTPYTVHTPAAGSTIGWGSTLAGVQDGAIFTYANVNFIDQSVSGIYTSIGLISTSSPLTFSYAINQPLSVFCDDTVTLGNGILRFIISYALGSMS